MTFLKKIIINDLRSLLIISNFLNHFMIHHFILKISNKNKNLLNLLP
jgi:hypothetical protein